jgi:hypothetical protein
MCNLIRIEFQNVYKDRKYRILDTFVIKRAVPANVFHPCRNGIFTVMNSNLMNEICQFSIEKSKKPIRNSQLMNEICLFLIEKNRIMILKSLFLNMKSVYRSVQ